ncbi:permease IIC component [Companilactobacillus sp. RD055328]|uniref:PTS sugar transporter subunit IIC n=1 Tax=Companilactobacillus sp. RD055328 TaxID=2916634 RepID=UPI001FC7F5CC|nr:PTS transporter subunit EIIC [Companilactobacillus sp. RD055328]GKQ43445.1 permease IIC component [Companilactobacillus sp. RD055328]
MKFNSDAMAGKMASLAGNRYLTAIRDGMSIIIPVSIVGSFFTIISQLPIEAWTKFIAPFTEALAVPVSFSIGFMSLYACYGIAASLANTYKLDKISSGTVATMVYLILAISPSTITPAGAKATGLLAGSAFPGANFGAKGLFTAMFAAIITVEVIRFFKERNIVIKMPKGVPSAVSNSFVALIPAAVLIIAAWLLKEVANFDVNAGLQTLFTPLGYFAKDNFGSVVVPILVNSVFWIFGVHGAAIATPIFWPYWYPNLTANMTAISHGATAATVPHFMTEQFFQWFVYIGGAGSTLAICILLTFFSKSSLGKTMGKVTIIPGIFNINEPIMFGLPIVLNPYFVIPFILAPLAEGVITYLATIMNLVNKTVALVPWTLPAPIGAFMATGFDWRAIVLVLINIGVSLAIYWPFFKAWDKNQVTKEKNAELEEA